MTGIMEGGEPFFLPGGDSGCLLIHGLTGSPATFRGLGQHLAARGFTVLAPRLTGHATRADDLARVHYRDWLADVEDAYQLLQPHCKRIVLVGYSMGGDLSIVFAATTRVDGLVLLSTPYQLPNDFRLRFIRPLSLFVPRIAKRASDWQSTEIPEPRHFYESYPTPAVAEFKDLLQEVQATLPQIQAPTLLIQSRQDGSRGVGLRAMPGLHAGLGSRDKEMIWIDGSGHSVLRDAQHQVVIEHVTRFIERVTGEDQAGA